MMTRVKWFAVFIWAAVLGLAPAPALAQDVVVPPLQARVTDTTGTLDAAAVQAIDSRLAALEQRKGAQVAVLMVPTTGTDSIEQYALRAFEQWQLGRKSVDDGILFVIAKDDRALRIEVGYGLEGAVPDLLAGRIIREQVVPRFQAGDFAGGVLAGVDSLIRLVDGEDLPPPATSAASTDDESSDLWGLLFLLFFFFATIPWVAAPLVGVVLYVVWGNVFIALGGAVVAFFVSRALRAWRNKGGGGKGGPGGGVCAVAPLAWVQGALAPAGSAAALVVEVLEGVAAAAAGAGPPAAGKPYKECPPLMSLAAEAIAGLA